MVEKEVKYMEYIKNKFPQTDISNVKFNLEDGKYSDIVIINQDTVFKFSRYDWTVAFLANEARVMNLIRDSVDMPLPQMEYSDNGVARYKLIKGTPLLRNEILLWRDSDQNYIARQIGTFLKQLHSISVKRVKTNGISEIPFNFSRDAILAEYEDIKRKVYPYLDSYQKESIEQIFAPMLENKEFLKYVPALIHADLTPPHIICDAELKKINTIIGFGRAGIGDPAYDFSILLGSFGETFVKRIARYYGDTTKLMDRARFYAHFNQLSRAKSVADMITTRDFSKFKFDFPATDVMPFD